MIQSLTTGGFADKVARGTAVVDFWAPWCVHCRPMLATVAEVAGDHPEVTFGKVNVDDEPDLAGRLGVRALPTVVVLRDGREVGRLTGSQPADAVRRLLAAHRVA